MIRISGSQLSLGVFFWLALMPVIVGSCAGDPAGTSNELTTDVLVVGGGAGGVAATIEAARSGVEVLLVEETPWLGGMLTAAGVSATDVNRRLPSGLWGEFRQQIYDHYGGEDSVETGWVSNTLFEPQVGNDSWNKMAEAEPNLSRYHGYRIIQVFKPHQLITGAAFVNDALDTLRIKAAITVEATELGDVLGLSRSLHRAGSCFIDSELPAPDQSPRKELA